MKNIKKYNEFNLNEGMFDDVIRPMFDPYISSDMKLKKNQYNGIIVDKKNNK